MRPLGSLVVAILLVACACVGRPVASPASDRPAPTRLAGPSNFPLIGSWVTTITPEDLEAAGIVDPGAQHENAGRFTWTFDPDGTWRAVQVSLDDAPIVTPVFQGTYVVDGDGVVVTTTFPEQYRDAGLRYSWQANQDGSVTFRLPNPPDLVLQVVVEAHPWQPTST